MGIYDLSDCTAACCFYVATLLLLQIGCFYHFYHWTFVLFLKFYIPFFCQLGVTVVIIFERSEPVYIRRHLGIFLLFWTSKILLLLFLRLHYLSLPRIVCFYYLYYQIYVLFLKFLNLSFASWDDRGYNLVRNRNRSALYVTLGFLLIISFNELEIFTVAIFMFILHFPAMDCFCGNCFYHWYYELFWIYLGYSTATLMAG